MILLDCTFFIIIDFCDQFNYRFCFLYIIHVIQSSDWEVFFSINDLSFYLSKHDQVESVTIYYHGHGGCVVFSGADHLSKV